MTQQTFGEGSYTPYNYTILPSPNYLFFYNIEHLTTYN